MQNKPEKGLIVRSTGSFYKVKVENTSELIDCTLRGKLRLNESKATNPVAVGDIVLVKNENGSYVITELLPRENAIYRKATRSHSQEQILCANIDQAILVASVVQPTTLLGFIDRFLVMTEAYHIPTIIIFNKVDLIEKEKDFNRLSDFIQIYQNVGYQVFALDATNPEYREAVMAILQNKVSFISGVSGAGKSTLINLAAPELKLRTSPISTHSGKGRHTTTNAEMYFLPFGGSIIDAPGFREFDITGIPANEIAHYFPEMRKKMHECKYPDCTHTTEPDCAVKKAVLQGAISETRYNTYTNMFDAVTANKSY